MKNIVIYRDKPQDHCCFGSTVQWTLHCKLRPQQASKTILQITC